jgi:nucleoside-diphosphate-sugar epimerase
MPRTLVTGAAGFLGRPVVRLLVERGDDVVALVRGDASRARLERLEGRVQVVQADLADAELGRTLESIAPDVCYHLAWFTSPGLYVNAVPENLSSLSAAANLFALLDRVGCGAIVFAGTCAEYGPAPEPIPEERRPRPRTVYGAAKLAAGTAGVAAAAAAGTTFAWARIFYPYGPDDQRDRFVPRLLRRLTLRQPVELPNRPDELRDYLYVDDVASALVTLGDAGHHGVANVCSGDATSMADLVARAAAAAGSDGSDVRLSVADEGEPLRTVGRPESLARLGWTPRWRLDEGLAETAAWIRADPA